MQRLAARHVMGIGSRVVLRTDGKSARLTVVDRDSRKRFRLNGLLADVAPFYLHPYLAAPAHVLDAVNERPTDSDTDGVPMSDEVAAFAALHDTSESDDDCTAA